MAKSVKEFIYDTRADLKKSLKFEIAALVCLIAGSILWYMTNPMFLIELSDIFGHKNLILITNVVYVFIFGLIAGSVTLTIMVVLMHYLRGKQVDLLISGMEAQGTKVIINNNVITQQVVQSQQPEVDEISPPKPKIQPQRPQAQVKKPAQATQPPQVQRKPTQQRRDVPPVRTPAQQKKTIIQRKPGR